MDTILGGALALYAFADLALVVVSLLVVFRTYHARQIMKRQLVAALALVVIFFVAPLVFLTAMYVQRTVAPAGDAPRIQPTPTREQ
jgi:hypothetical protein